MPRVAFSVRFPVDLAAVLDGWVKEHDVSRSDVVEAIIEAAAAEDRDVILGVAVGPATERVNLRLSPERLAQLKATAAGVPPAEFLRLAVAWAIREIGPTTTPTTGEAEAEFRPFHVSDTQLATARAAMFAFIGLTVLAILLFLRHVCRVDAWTTEGYPPVQGQLGDGTAEGSPA